MIYTIPSNNKIKRLGEDQLANIDTCPICGESLHFPGEWEVRDNEVLKLYFVCPKCGTEGRIVFAIEPVAIDYWDPKDAMADKDNEGGEI